MIRLFVFGAVVAVALASSGLVVAQGDPINGTWKLNLAKTQFNPGPPPKSQTRTYEASSNGLKLSVEGIDADGNRVAYGFISNYDGKDYPYTGHIPNGSDTIALKRIDAHTVEFTTKKGGKVFVTGSIVISKDGKLQTITSRGTNASGQPTSSVQVFDKQ
jgi:hypothetical protein